MQEIFAFLILCFSYPSTILGREKVIVLNLEVLLRDPMDDNVIPTKPSIDCSYLDARTRELEIDAYPALEELISKGIFLNVVISKTTMVLVLPMGFPNSPAIGSKISRANTAAATQEDNDIEEFEIEAYHTQIDGTLNKLIMLREYVDDTRIMSIFRSSPALPSLCYLFLSTQDTSL
ncbi:hypothetical protein ACOSQ2_001410 [Xanthoceras sorbifolium]